MSSKEKKVRYTAIEDLAHDLGISEWDLRALLLEISQPIRLDHRGREAVPDTCIASISNSESYGGAIRHALISEARQKSANDNSNAKVLRERRKILLKEYRPMIAEAERIHRKYLNSANEAGQESAGMAAYLLISRVISTLKIVHDCLEIGHWYLGSLLREIDECRDVALYFVITKDSPEGASARQKWFRRNIAPKHAACRETISTWHASLLSVDSKKQLELMNEVYRKKSKWTHPTYLTIREVASFEVRDKVALVSVDYGPCTYERKLLEVTEVLRLSIRSTFQSLSICLSLALSLSEEDASIVLEFNRKI